MTKRGVLLVFLLLMSCGADQAKESPRVAAPPVIPVTAASSSDAGSERAIEPVVEDERAVPASPIVPQPASVSDRAKRHRPAVLDGPVRPTKIASGTYQCRISAEYRLRPCTVTRDAAGWAWLEMPSALVALNGVIYDDGPNTLVFEGAPTERRPFGCFACDERCTANPDSCFCKEHLEEASQRCLEQPANIRFAKQGGSSSWSGTLSWDTYFNVFPSAGARPTGFTVDKKKLPVLIAPKP